MIWIVQLAAFFVAGFLLGNYRGKALQESATLVERSRVINYLRRYCKQPTPWNPGRPHDLIVEDLVWEINCRMHLKDVPRGP